MFFTSSMRILEGLFNINLTERQLKWRIQALHLQTNRFNLYDSKRLNVKYTASDSICALKRLKGGYSAQIQKGTNLICTPSTVSSLS